MMAMITFALRDTALESRARREESASIWLPLSHGVENTQLITTAGFNWSIRADMRS
jgi:hypothetical protein